MQYIHLNNDSYIIHTSQGAFTLTRESFNFNKVKRLLSNDAEEDKVLPLLTPPELPDGVFKAFLTYSGEVMYILHYQEEDGTITTTCQNFNGVNMAHSPDAKLMGIYASKEDLILDWPEYTI